MNMKCDTCTNIGDYSVLRIGKKCGRCKNGKYFQTFLSPKNKSKTEKIEDDLEFLNANDNQIKDKK